jgi:hypothetical protein
VGEQYAISGASSTIANCYATGNASSSGSYIGGLVGYQYAPYGGTSTIIRCYAIGNVSSSGSDSNIGGLVGYQFAPDGTSSIISCYATGNVIGIKNVGGLVGFQYVTGNTNIANCYATGNVTATGSNFGGIVGTQLNISGGNALTNNYRYQLMKTNGVVRTENTPNGIHGGTVTETQLKTQATYTANKWTFGVGQWYWDSRGFPKLNIGNEGFPFRFISVTGVTVAPKTASIAVGKTQTLTATVVPANATNKNVTWSSNSAAIATVSTTGVVTGVSTGAATIMVKTVDGGFMDSCAVTVTGITPGDSPSNPITITTAAQLDDIRNGLNKYYRLSGNIDLTSYLSSGGAGYAKWSTAGWMPIGTPTTPFTGGLDGNGQRISGLWINRPNTSFLGLFGYTKIATIKNLGVEISSSGVKGASYVGGLAGFLYADNGGISTVTNCYVTGNISGTSSYVGGMIGSQNSYNGNISILNCYTTGNVSASSYYVGGLVGEQFSYNGNNIIIIANCYATGNINGNNYVGGLVGGQYSYSSNCNILNSYATGNVSGNSIIGGLTGYQFASYGSSNIMNCYATGNASGSSAGGLVGGQSYSTSGTCTIANSYRYQLTTINGVVRTENTPNGIHGGVVTASQLKTQSTYTNNKWTFAVGHWYWDSRGFPKLNIGVENVPFRF